MTTARFVLAVFALLSLSATAHAQDRSRRHVTELAPTVIEGHRQRPLSIILTRTPMHYSPPDLRTSFVREIVRASAP